MTGVQTCALPITASVVASSVILSVADLLTSPDEPHPAHKAKIIIHDNITNFFKTFSPLILHSNFELYLTSKVYQECITSP